MDTNQIIKQQSLQFSNLIQQLSKEQHSHITKEHPMVQIYRDIIHKSQNLKNLG